jgi:predicted O-linked N-acetylglucosamine transferase (SPINDLY family)
MTLLEQARNLYSSGQPGEALRIVKGGLAIEKHDKAGLCEVAAVSAQALRDFAQAESFWRRAIALDPKSAGMQHGLGLLLAMTGRAKEAEPCFRRATELQPRFAEAHFCLGRCLTDSNQLAAAEQSFRRALALDARLAPAHLFLGLALFNAGRSAEAEKCYRRAVALDGNLAEAFNYLGVLLSQAGRLDEAEESLRRAIFLGPEYASAFLNLGTLLAEQRRDAEAEQCFRKAIACDPGSADACLKLGNLLNRMRRHEEAEMCFRRAIELDESHADAHVNLGGLYMKLGRHAAAESAFRHAIALDARNAAMLPMVVHAATQAGSWRNFATDTGRIRPLLNQNDLHPVEPFVLNAIPGLTPLEHKYAARKFALEVVNVDALGELVPRESRRPRQDRIRIGYLSAHFHNHAVAVALAGVLEAHDSGRFAVSAYSYGRQGEDEGRQRIRGACAAFRDLQPLSDEAAAGQIAADGIDILVDLVGYTSDGRPAISAWRPAPVLVNWLGYPGTLGHPRMADYIVGDPIVTPLAHAGHFSETLALMPHCYHPYDRSRSVGPRPGRQEVGLPEDGFVFCSFQQCYKLNPPMFDLWCRLLRDVPRSVLWLQEPGADAVANLRGEAAARGVDPGRLIFAPRVKSPSAYLGRLQLADLALDTYPYTSHSTGSDLLWAGVPLVTTIGETFATRVAASLLHAVGLPELVAGSHEAYFAIARQLALDPDSLEALRARLARLRSTAPLFDTARFTRDLERLYREIWRQHQGNASGPIVLAPEGAQC